MTETASHSAAAVWYTSLQIQNYRPIEKTPQFLPVQEYPVMQHIILETPHLATHAHQCNHCPQ